MSTTSHSGHDHGNTVEVLQRDPSRTTTVRQQYARGVRGALRGLRAVLRRAVVEDDVFGLQADALAEAPRGFDFPSNADKERAFNNWLDRQLRNDVLQAYGEDNQYISRAYERGVRDANIDLRQVRSVDDVQDVSVALQLPVHRDAVEAIQVRNYRQLQGMNASIGQDMSRVLSDGLAGGDGPREVAGELTDILGQVDDGTPRGAMARATTIARTEILNAHHQAQFTQWDEFGVTRVEPVLAADACDICQSLAAGAPYELSEARSLWPAHPNCRCSPTIYTGS